MASDVSADEHIVARTPCNADLSTPKSPGSPSNFHYLPLNGSQIVRIKVLSNPCSP